MVFKDRKIPKHLVIREEYELRRRRRSGLFRFVLVSLVVVGLTYVVSAGLATM